MNRRDWKVPQPADRNVCATSASAADTFRMHGVAPSPANNALHADDPKVNSRGDAGSDH